MAYADSYHFRWRRPLRSALLGVALIGVIALAAVGAVLGLALLAVGALVHGVIRMLRPRPQATPPSGSGGRVIDADYVIVSGPGSDTRDGVPRAR